MQGASCKIELQFQDAGGRPYKQTVTVKGKKDELEELPLYTNKDNVMGEVGVPPCKAAPRHLVDPPRHPSARHATGFVIPVAASQPCDAHACRLAVLLRSACLLPTPNTNPLSGTRPRNPRADQGIPGVAEKGGAHGH